jgi:hypothetical protein
MRALVGFALCLSLLGTLRADEALNAALSGERQVSAGKAYGANTFAGMLVGSLIGTAAGALPYSMERKNQDPGSVILGAVYGAVGGAVAFGLPLSAYEVASDKPGAGITVIYNTLGFAVLGAAVGAGTGMLEYRSKIDSDPRAGEAFLSSAAIGLCGGALLGFGVGVFEAVLWQGRGLNVPGKGIHAKAGILELAAWHDDGITVSALPNATLLKLGF